MNPEDLEFNVKHAASVLERTADLFNHTMTDSNDALNIRSLCEIIGELSGEVARLHDAMELELKNRKTKKFWQIWK